MIKFEEYLNDFLCENKENTDTIVVKNKNGGKLGEIRLVTGVPVFNFDKKYASQYNYGISDIETILDALKANKGK